MPTEKVTSGAESSSDSDVIEVTGCTTRADWEDLYLATRQLARKHGLTVEDFELTPAGDETSQAAVENADVSQETAADSE